jgi:hypothetical protein
VPSGTWLCEGGAVVERFRCGPGPAGWRCVSDRTDAATGALLSRLDLVLDATGRTLRLRVEAGGWELRGGAVGPDLLWRRAPQDDSGEQERTERAAAFTGPSPAYDVACARLLGLAPGQSRRVRLVELVEPALAALTVDRAWTLSAVEDRDGLPVARYQVDDLATGERRVVRVAGDVVVAGDDVELVGLTR